MKIIVCFNDFFFASFFYARFVASDACREAYIAPKKPHEPLQDVPRCPREGPRGPRNAPKSGPGHPKNAPKKLGKGSRGPQDGSRGRINNFPGVPELVKSIEFFNIFGQDGFQRPQEASKKAQVGPKRPQERPERPPDAPKTSPRGPQGPQEVPKTPQDAPRLRKTAQDGPEWTPNLHLFCNNAKIIKTMKN